MEARADTGPVSLLLSVHSVPRNEEDSIQPCEDERVVCLKENNSLLIAVMDGCGGTGGKHYQQAENWTGAKLASHLAGQALYDWFSETETEPFSRKEPIRIAEEIRTVLSEALLRYNTELRENDAGSFVIRSSMNKDLPTTLAAIVAIPKGERSFEIQSYWAGNSRNYVLMPGGLKQISTDDIVGNYDPYEDLLKDGILSNCVNASVPFQIHESVFRSEEPCMILSASDGIFGYLDSPIRLEGILLSTLQKAGTPLQWEELLRKIFGAYSGDDHTLQLAALGFSSFEEMKKTYHNRTKFLDRNLIRPLEKAEKRADNEAVKALWTQYKKDYLILQKELEECDER